MSVHHEKRRYARSPRTVCAWLSFQEDPSTYGTLTVDLGPGGARFGLLNPVEIDAKLILRLEIPPANIECKGCVRWTSLSANGLHYFGVKFVDLSEGEFEALAHFASENASIGAAV